MADIAYVIILFLIENIYGNPWHKIRNKSLQKYKLQSPH